MILNSLFEQVLIRRGITQTDFLKMNDPTHRPLARISEACGFLDDIKRTNGVVVVYPDFDTDGIMSGVIGLAGLSELGFNARLFIPDVAEGYGMSPESIDRLINEFPDVTHIVTCDVGITAHRAIEHAIACGLHVMVTDHHRPDDVDNEAEVIIDPYYDDDYELKAICGAHVLWQVLEAYAKYMNDAFLHQQILRLRVFAGIGTVSDSMLMLNENRALVTDSVAVCRAVYGTGTSSIFIENIRGSENYVNAFRGLRRMLVAFAEAGSIKSASDINEDFFGFYLSPTFNAVKRMGLDIGQSFAIFFGPESKSAVQFAMNANTERKATVKAVTEHLRGLVDDFKDQDDTSVFMCSVDTLPGLLGLIAGNICATTVCPTVVTGLPDEYGEFSGSARMPYGFDGLTPLRDAGIFAAGHGAAFGIRFKAEDAAVVEEVLTKAFARFLMENDVNTDGYDVEITWDGGIDIPLFVEFASNVEHFRPYGVGFPAPTLAFHVAMKTVKLTTIGSEHQHIKGVLPGGFSFLIWNAADRFDELSEMDKVTLVGTISLSQYSRHDGTVAESVSFIVRDVFEK